MQALHHFGSDMVKSEEESVILGDMIQIKPKATDKSTSNRIGAVLAMAAEASIRPFHLLASAHQPPYHLMPDIREEREQQTWLILINSRTNS